VSQITDSGGRSFSLMQPSSDDTRLRTDVDRDTLTILKQQVLDPHDRVLMAATYRHYRLFGDIAWPMQMIFTSEQGRIQLDLDSVEINRPPLPAAFVPPKRAEKLP
jgi:hypothetical protein